MEFRTLPKLLFRQLVPSASLHLEFIHLLLLFSNCLYGTNDSLFDVRTRRKPLFRLKTLPLYSDLLDFINLDSSTTGTAREFNEFTLEIRLHWIHSNSLRVHHPCTPFPTLSMATRHPVASGSMGVWRNYLLVG